MNYHNATKHYPHRYAASLGYMDWANQPNPFRFFKGSRTIGLPFIEQDPPSSHSDLYRKIKTPPRPFSLKHLAGLLELSLGLSAWKMLGSSKWSLRMNPSSGNLHPTESYWMVPELDSVGAGLYHYNPLLHAFAARALFPDTVMARWKALTKDNGFLFLLSSIFWRESWKYGERAFRYCLIDAGHALAAISIAANLMGWKVTCLQKVNHQSLDELGGFDQTGRVEGEAENAELLCWVAPRDTEKIPDVRSDFLSSISRRLELTGIPEPLSKETHSWPLIERVSRASGIPEILDEVHLLDPSESFHMPESRRSAYQIIRRRRSAVDMDPTLSTIDRKHFLGCILATLPHHGRPPFNAKIHDPSIHLFIFAHNVRNLAPGLYSLVRNPDHIERLQQSTRKEFLWEPVEDPAPLYLLKPGDFRKKAADICCFQDIAGQGAFSLGMVGNFKDIIQKEPFRYRHLFWETGMIGQVLYLQAEAYGLRGTGIGCFFDEAMHDVCGLTDGTFQSLYHFTVGYPIRDERLSTLPAYHHLKYLNKDLER